MQMKRQSKRVLVQGAHVLLYVVSEKIPTLFLSVSARCVHYIFLFSRIRNSETMSDLSK